MQGERNKSNPTRPAKKTPEVIARFIVKAHLKFQSVGS
jgi:hypothetical protein